MKYIGKEMSRVDGVAKVTGAAKYAVEFQSNNLAYGFIVQSTIAKGAIASIDTAEAEKASGVIRVLTHLNVPKLAYTDKTDKDEMAPAGGAPLRALYSDKIMFSGQPIALVVAETYEQARFAAHLVKATYTAEKAATDTENLLRKLSFRRLKIRRIRRERRKFAVIRSRLMRVRRLKSKLNIRFRSSITIRSKCTARLPPGKAIN